MHIYSWNNSIRSSLSPDGKCLNFYSVWIQVLPMERSRTLLVPYSVVGHHPNIDPLKEVMFGSSCVYAIHTNTSKSREDLHAFVRRRRRLPEPEAARLFSQILSAVIHCHQHGVIIRDIKLRRFLFADEERLGLHITKMQHYIDGVLA